MCGNSSRPSGTSATPSVATTGTASPTISRPRKAIRPPVGRSSPATARRIVALPEPTSRRSTVSIGPSALAAEVRPDDLRVPPDLGRRPLGDLAAEVEHDDPVAHAHDEPHEVLDHQDRGAAVADTLDQPDRLHDLRRGQPRVDLVEEQQPRAGRERARQLEASELHDREALRRRQRLAGEPDDIEGRACLVRRSLDAGDTAAEERGDGDVVETGEAAEGLRDLERAADAEPRDAVRRQPGEVTAVEANGPRVGRADARDRVDQGALAGAVGPDEPDDLARRDLEVH